MRSPKVFVGGLSSPVGTLRKCPVGPKQSLALRGGGAKQKKHMKYNPNKLDFNFLKNYSSSQLLYESLSVGLISTNGYYFTYSPKLLNQKELDGFEKITVSEFLKNDSI